MPTAVGGLGQAGSAQAFATAQAQQAGASKKGSTGSALGQVAAEFVIKSDVRLKDNIEKIGVINGHNIYQWEWNDIAKGLGVNDPTTGVIAQELRETHPELVFVDSDSGYLEVDYGNLMLSLESG
ncbi:MAG: tail fiber domain-containing protein [Proteobacteria bacterium]|nr:tail fiber domain-containing protein [Pseudomonadota bacterium]